MRLISSSHRLRGRLCGTLTAVYDIMWPNKIVTPSWLADDSRFVSISCSPKSKVEGQEDSSPRLATWLTINDALGNIICRLLYVEFRTQSRLFLSFGLAFVPVSPVFFPLTLIRWRPVFV